MHSISTLYSDQINFKVRKFSEIKVNTINLISGPVRNKYTDLQPFR